MSVNQEAIKPSKKVNVFEQHSQTKRLFSTRNLVKIAMLSAVAGVLQLIEFQVPMTPGWLKMDFSDLPALLASFGIGPIAGVFVELIKNIMHCVIKGTSTGFVGELANFLLGASFVVPAGLIYRLFHSKKGAMIGMGAGIVAFCVAGIFLNIYVLMPMYQQIMPIDVIMGMAQAANPYLDSINKIVLFGVTPFNLFKGCLLSLATLLLYKPLSPLLHK